MRRALWKVAGDAAGQQCAQERLYRSRQPAEPVSASVRAAERAGGENLRQFWTPGQEHAAHIAARKKQLPSEPAAEPATQSNAKVGRGGARAGSGPRQKLSMEDGMYMLARVLRGGQTVAQAAPDFGVAQQTAGQYFRSHARALAEVIRRELPEPTQAEIFESTPQSSVW